MDFHGSNRYITNLSISYSDKQFPGQHLLYVDTCPRVKGKKFIEATGESDVRLALPRIGLIEKSGKYLEYLGIDMGFGFDEINPLSQKQNPDVTLPSILQKCPHLLGIKISSTALNLFGSDLEKTPKSVDILDYLTIYGEMISETVLNLLGSDPEKSVEICDYLTLYDVLISRVF